MPAYYTTEIISRPQSAGGLLLHTSGPEQRKCARAARAMACSQCPYLMLSIQPHKLLCFSKFFFFWGTSKAALGLRSKMDVVTLASADGDLPFSMLPQTANVTLRVAVRESADGDAKRVNISAPRQLLFCRLLFSSKTKVVLRADSISDCGVQTCTLDRSRHHFQLSHQTPSRPLAPQGCLGRRSRGTSSACTVWGTQSAVTCPLLQATLLARPAPAQPLALLQLILRWAGCALDQATWMRWACKITVLSLRYVPPSLNCPI